jgi:hypothetical protein
MAIMISKREVLQTIIDAVAQVVGYFLPKHLSQILPAVLGNRTTGSSRKNAGRSDDEEITLGLGLGNTVVDGPLDQLGTEQLKAGSAKDAQPG